MKIKLSKSQWEQMGKKAGWMRESQSMFANTEHPSHISENLIEIVNNMRGYLNIQIDHNKEWLEAIDEDIATGNVSNLKKHVAKFYGDSSTETRLVGK